MGCCYASYYINCGTGIESMVEEGVGEALTQLFSKNRMETYYYIWSWSIMQQQTPSRHQRLTN